jgi:hypothetical protein
VFSVAARANLFLVEISTRTYSLNNRGEIIMRVGNRRQFIDLVQQANPGIDAKLLTLVYDTETDALEVVRSDDGTLIAPIMTFSNGLKISNAAKTTEYRQAFLTLDGTAVTTGTAVVSGTVPISGSVAGPVRIGYDSKDNIQAFRWDGDFEYNIPGTANAFNEVVHGHFVLGREVRVRVAP